MPWQSLLVQLLHEWIWVELLYVPYAWFLPDALEEHHGTNHGWHTGGVAYALHTGFVVSLLVLAVVINVVGALLAILLTADAATDRCFAVIVLAEILWVRQYGLEELQRNNLHLGCLARTVCQWSLVFDFVDAAHAEVLDAVEVGEILLAEGHPETCLLDGRVVLHQTLQLLVVHQIALARTDVRVGERLVDRERVGFNPFAILIPESLLGNFADIDFWVEVGCESLVMVTGVAIHDVEHLNLIEVMFGCISGEDARNSWVKTAAEDSAETSLFELILVCPLP